MQLQQIIPSLLRQVGGMSAMCPHLWRRIDAWRERRTWPSWCFLPAEELGRALGAAPGVSPRAGSNLNAMAALAAWRVTQGVYQFDSDLFQAVWSTPLDRQIPAEILLRLPEWCVYVVTPDRSFAGHTLRGFFAHLDYSGAEKRAELRVILDPGEDRLFSALPVELGGASLLSALEESRGRLLRRLGNNADADALEHLRAMDMEDYADLLAPLLNLLLYLCSANAETFDAKRGSPHHPRPQNARTGLRYFPPATPAQWQVGFRLGAALRAALARDHSSAIAPGQRSSPRAHIRRAHWHSYWTGPLSDRESRRVGIRWIPPVAVNVTEDHLCVPVVRSVAATGTR